jgi:hypothetical protein
MNSRFGRTGLVGSRGLARPLLLALAALACGKTSTMVPVHARIVHGPGFAGSAAVQPAIQPAVPSAGHWFISPDQGQVTLTDLTFRGDKAGSSAHVTLTNCSPIYKRSDASLSAILDCAFQVPSGTYIGVDIGVATTAQVLINDTVHGIYTDPASPTGLSSSPPAGGAQLVPMTVPGPGGSGNVLTIEAALTTPFVVGNGQADGGSQAIELTIVEDMIHTVFVDVNGSTLRFDTSLPLPPVFLVPSVSGPGKVEYYSPTGTGQNVSIGPGGTGNEAGSVRLFYAPPPQPTFVWHVVNGPSESFAANPAKYTGSGFKPGGYLGLDASGTACWALPTDFSWTSYSQLCEMKVPANVGGTATLQCST